MAAVVLAGVEDREQVRVQHLRGGARLLPEARRERLVREQVDLQQLDRDGLAVRLPHRAEHEPHPTLAERLLEAVPGDRVPGLELLGRQVPHRRASIRPGSRSHQTPSQSAQTVVSSGRQTGGDREDGGRMATTATGAQPGEKTGMSFGRLVVGYGIVTVFLVVAIGISITLGNEREPATAIGATTPPKAASASRASSSSTSRASSSTLDGRAAPTASSASRTTQLTGDVTCADGTTAAVDLTVAGAGESSRLAGTVGDEQVTAHLSQELPEPGASAKPPEKRSGEETFGRLMLAIAAVILAARAGRRRCSRGSASRG